MENNEEKKKKKRSKLILLGLIGLAGSAVIAGLMRDNVRLRKRCWNYEGQIKNQEHVIKGLHKTLERTSYINGKLSRV